MLGIKRKISPHKQSSAANTREFRPPKGLSTVCPEIGDARTAFYDNPALAIANRLRFLPISPDATLEDPTRLSWQYAVAVQSINMLDHFPIQALMNVHGERKWDFHRAVYWRALVAGIGGWLHKFTLLTKQGEPVNPLTDEWGRVHRLAVSSGKAKMLQGIAPSTMEFMFASQAGFIALADDLDPDVRTLFFDSFGADHHSRNPIAASVALAQIKMRKRLTQRGLYMDDKPGVSWLNRTEVLQVEMPTPVTQAPKAPPSKEPAAHRTAQSDVPADKPKTETEPMPEEKAIRDAGIKPDAKWQPRGKTDYRVAQGQDIDPRIIARLIRDRIKSGVLMVNRPGAQIEVGPHGPGLVMPKTFYQLAEMLDVTFEQLEPIIMESMIDKALSFPQVDYRIRRKGKGWGKVKLAVLAPVWHHEIFPDGVPKPNPELSISDESKDPGST